jgi:hypothetical protein
MAGVATAIMRTTARRTFAACFVLPLLMVIPPSEKRHLGYRRLAREKGSLSPRGLFAYLDRTKSQKVNGCFP